MTVVADDHSATAAVFKPERAVLFRVDHCTVTVWVVGAGSVTVTGGWCDAQGLVC